MIFDQWVRELSGKIPIGLLFLALVLSSCTQVAERVVFVEKNITVYVKEECGLRCVPCQEIVSASLPKIDKCLRNETELGECQVNETIHGVTKTWSSVHCKENEVAIYWNNGVCSCERKRC